MLRRYIAIIFFILGLAGCGAEWFPDDEVTGETPDAFSFSPVPCARPGIEVVSNEITISGLAVSGSTAAISISGSPSTASHMYAVTVKNGSVDVTAWYTSPGTVKNGDRVKVKHTTTPTTSSATGLTVTTLTIGNRSAAFVSNTATFSQYSSACVK